MKIKLKKSIGFKMAVALTISLFVVISFFSHTNIRLSEKRLLNMAENEAAKMSAAIKSSLDNAMMNNEEAGVQLLIGAIGQETHIYDIKVINIDGMVTHAKNKADIGAHLDMSEKSCAFCHDIAEVNKNNLTILYDLDDGSKILRNVNPIHNEKRCYECHDQQEDILGKLLVDFTTNDIDAIVTDNRKLLIISAIGTLLTSVFICFLLTTALVKKPLYKLLQKMKSFDVGSGDEEEVIIGEDEIAVLDETHDGLMADIEVRNQKIKRQMRKINKQMKELALFNVSEIFSKSTSIEENVDLIINALNLGFRVEECAVLLLDGVSFKSKGALGMVSSQTETLAGCLSEIEQLDKIKEGNSFVVATCGAIQTDFLVVPLKVANNIIGVLTVHAVADMDIQDKKLQESFAIIATSLAPHLQIALSQSEKQEMQVSPFNSFLASVDREISKMQEYMANLSLVLIKITNYQDLCRSKSVQEASDLVQDVAVQLSANITVVHECSRISADSIIIILPMLDFFEAPEAVNPAIDMVSSEAQLSTNITTYPDNGQTALELLQALADS